MIGVAFGNLLQGVPFHADEYLRLFYTGNFFQLLNPFGLLAGVISVAMILARARLICRCAPAANCTCSRTAAQISALVMLVGFVLAGVWVKYGIDGYVLKSAIDHHAASNPLGKDVVREAGAWLVNFEQMPVLWLFPLLGALLPLLTILCSRMEKGAWAFIFFADADVRHYDGGHCAVPFIMPSSTVPHQPDHVGRDLQLADAADHDRGCHHLCADHSGLHQLVLLQDVWPHHQRTH